MSFNDTGVSVKAHISTSGSQGDTHADGRVHCGSKVTYCIVVRGRTGLLMELGIPTAGAALQKRNNRMALGFLNVTRFRF